MKPPYSEFLRELYAIDPALREHESELIPLITELLKRDPATAPDADFIASLRIQLRERAATLSTSSSPFSIMQKLLYILGGALTTAVVLPLVYIGVQQSNTPTSTPLFGYEVKETDDQAFGSLAGLAPSASIAGRGGGAGGGGGGGLGLGGDAVVQTTANYAESESKMIAPYPMIQYEYVYNGKLADLAATVPVYKKTPSRSTLPLSALTSRLNFGTLDMNTFAGMNVDSLNFTQDVPFGYQLYVSLRDSTVNIDANWEQWPQSKCATEECYRGERVTPDQIPADSELIALAQSFAGAHAIDLSRYGEPEVDHAWKVDYERMTDKSQAYVPEVQRVVFPLLIDGKPVYDQSGIKTGIAIGVHVKHKKVMNVWGITDRTYTKSDYTGVTDPAAITNFLTTVDNYYPMAIDTMPAGTPAPKKVRVELGEPTVSFVMYYRYDKTPSEELLIPSLIFPVMQSPDTARGEYYRQTVVVPLASDMLAQQMPGGVRPLMMEKAVDSSVE